MTNEVGVRNDEESGLYLAISFWHLQSAFGNTRNVICKHNEIEMGWDERKYCTYQLSKGKLAELGKELEVEKKDITNATNSNQTVSSFKNARWFFAKRSTWINVNKSCKRSYFNENKM